jgi:hypothetical protein
MTRGIQSPLEDVVGLPLSAIKPLASKATGEAGFNVKAQARLFTSMFTRGMQDAADIMSKGTFGKSDIDFAFGGRKTVLPPEAVELFGRLHSALKAPIKRGIFERSLEKRIAANIKNGNDVGDVNVQMRIATQAYKDANRAIFMQDNLISSAYQKMLNALENNKNHKELGTGAAAAAKFMIPFVKVPTNIVGETITTSPVGLALAGAKLLKTTFTEGLKNMSEDDADMVMRMIKKGALGTAAMIVAYNNPQAFGGFYQQGEQRKDSDLRAGQMKLFGVQLPSWLLHAPIFNAMQLAATVIRVQDKYMTKHDKSAVLKGLIAGGVGMAEEMPLLQQPVEVGRLLKDKERQVYAGELAKNTLVPGALQFAAKVERGYNPWTEKTAHPPQLGTIGAGLKSGIPILTEQVPNRKRKAKTW